MDKNKFVVRRSEEAEPTPVSKTGFQAKVREVKGSILAPVNAGLKMTLVACSQSGSYSSPLYDAMVKRYPKIKEDYRGLFINQNLKIGAVYTTAVNSEVWILQAVCMDKEGVLDETALKACVKKAVSSACYEGASLHLSELLFNDVPELKEALTAEAIKSGVNIYLYVEPTK